MCVMCMASTTGVLVEMLHKWYEATDVTGDFVRVLFLDYRKAFDVINHDMLIDISKTVKPGWVCEDKLSLLIKCPNGVRLVS